MSTNSPEHGSPERGQNFVAAGPDGTPLTRFGTRLNRFEVTGDHDKNPDMTDAQRANELQQLNDIPTVETSEFGEDEDGQLEMFAIPQSPTQNGERVRATAKPAYEAVNSIVSGAERLERFAAAMKRRADKLNDAADRWNERESAGERFKRMGAAAINQVKEVKTSIVENIAEIREDSKKFSAQRKEAALARKAERAKTRETNRAMKEAQREDRARNRMEDKAYRENEKFDRKERRHARIVSLRQSIGRAALAPFREVREGFRENIADLKVGNAKYAADKLQAKAKKAAEKADAAQTKYAEKAYANNRY